MSTKKLKVVFMGSPEFAVPTLEALCGCPDIEVIGAVTQPDRPRGRGRTVSPTPVRAVAERFGVPVSVMTKENYASAAREIASLSPDAIVVVAFGIILKEDLLELPHLGCVNLHASLLPKYRGVSPIQAALLAGDEETGCVTILMDRGIDTGDILLSEPMRIEPDDTAGSLGKRLAAAGSDLVVRTLIGLRDGRIVPRKQDPHSGSYTKKIRKENGQVDWKLGPDAISRLIRAMNPWPGAFTFLSGKRLILSEGRTMSHEPPGKPPGTVLSLAPFVVACGEGTLEIPRLKPEGRREMTAREFLSGSAVEVGEVLGQP